MTHSPIPAGNGEVRIPIQSRRLPAELHVPVDATGVVLIAHGSGTTFRSVRNSVLAQALQDGGLATLSLDLHGGDEARERHNVFDVDLQAPRLGEAAQWLQARDETSSLPLGYFGSGAGAGAVLLAAAREPERVSAVVSRRRSAGHGPVLAAEGAGADAVRRRRARSTQHRLERQSLRVPEDGDEETCGRNPAPPIFTTAPASQPSRGMLASGSAAISREQEASRRRGSAPTRNFP